MLQHEKDPRLVEAGYRGAARRWGPQRKIHIGDLSPAQRELVIQFIEAQRKADVKEDAPVRSTTEASVEAGRGSVEAS